MYFTAEMFQNNLFTCQPHPRLSAVDPPSQESHSLRRLSFTNLLKSTCLLEQTEVFVKTCAYSRYLHSILILLELVGPDTSAKTRSIGIDFWLQGIHSALTIQTDEPEGVNMTLPWHIPRKIYNVRRKHWVSTIQKIFPILNFSYPYRPSDPSDPSDNSDIDHELEPFKGF